MKYVHQILESGGRTRTGPKNFKYKRYATIEKSVGNLRLATPANKITSAYAVGSIGLRPLSSWQFQIILARYLANTDFRYISTT
jgi:hypothetical protein